jgi:dihydrolipoamide dehydrogenase
VIGGGIIGLEMATVHDALGSEVVVVEMLDELMAGADPDVVKPLRKRIEKRYEAIHTGTKVEAIKATAEGIVATYGGSDETFDRVLVAVGRRPNGGGVDADKAGVEVDERGFISVDEQMRTNVSHIFAIGDVVGEPMLAHKATHEAKVAAEVIAGENVAFDAKAIPSVAYTDPEVAWMGLTEAKAKEDGTEVETAVFPWAASGRAIGMGRTDGMTKLVLDPESKRLLGAGIVGINAGELIAELVHALEMGADAEDIGLTIHPHPTLSESVGMAAEVGLGTITDLPPKRKKSRR